jgi:hypothetical protein
MRESEFFLKVHFDALTEKRFIAAKVSRSSWAHLCSKTEKLDRLVDKRVSLLV